MFLRFIVNSYTGFRSNPTNKTEKSVAIVPETLIHNLGLPSSSFFIKIMAPNKINQTELTLGQVTFQILLIDLIAITSKQSGKIFPKN